MSLSTEQLHELFKYDITTGKLLYRKNQRGRGSIKAGDEAGTLLNPRYPNGYKVVMIKGKRYYIHRLVWLYHGNVLPETRSDTIGFKDGDKSNTRIENLELVSHAKNVQDGMDRAHESNLNNPNLPDWLS